MATTKAPKAAKSTVRTFVQSIPGNLAHSRSLNPGLFVMSATNQAGSIQEVPVTVEQHAGVGTQGFHMSDPHSALSAASGNPSTTNPYRVERARLPADRDTLVVRGSIRVLGAAFEPESCTGIDYLRVQQAFVTKFKTLGGFDQLAERYLMNVINGRWLFRNRMSPEVRVTVSIDGVKESFDANAIQGGYSLSIADLPAEKQENALALAALWVKALTGATPMDVKFVEVCAHVYLGVNAEVYPSQEFTEKGDDTPAKVLASVTLANGTRQAVLHDQKVGNGVRTIDTWYSESAFAIPVEAYGSVPRRQRSERLETEGAKNFFDLQSDLPGLVESMEQNWDNALFFGAMLVRGGLFGRSTKAPKKAAAEAETADAEA